MSRKGLGILLAAAAAYGAYRYSKMSPIEKENLKAKGKDLLEKGKEEFNNFVNKEFKNLMNEKEPMANASQSAQVAENYYQS